MKTRPSFLKPPATVLVLGAALLFSSPALAQDCVQFQGIKHCPVGDATLHLTEAGLVVQNHGNSSGVSSRFAPTTLWSADVEMPEGEAPHTALASISGGETTSRLLVEPEDGKENIRATFTGNSENPTYSVLVYRRGVLQAAAGGLYAGEGAPKALVGPHAKIDIYIGGVRIWPPRPRRPHFFIAPNGGCNWGLEYGQAVSVLMPDGNTVRGDRIVFAEDVDGPGHYPYLGFEAIETVSSASSFVITDELAEGTR